jgi:tetratricopeptide (TPR) repeat protein
MTAYQNQEYEKALARFEEMLRIDPDNNEARRYLGLCKDLLAKKYFDQGNRAAQNGDWANAKDAFTSALSYKPDYSEAVTALYKVQQQMGERMEEQKKRDSERYTKQALDAFMGDDREKAVELWQRALELDPENIEAARWLNRMGSEDDPAP